MGANCDSMNCGCGSLIGAIAYSKETFGLSWVALNTGYKVFLVLYGKGEFIQLVSWQQGKRYIQAYSVITSWAYLLTFLTVTTDILFVDCMTSL